MLNLSFYNSTQHFQSTINRWPLEIGAHGRIVGGDHDLVVELLDPRCSECHCVIHWNEEGQSIEIKNFGRSIVLSSGQRIHRGQSIGLSLPATFSLGDTHFQLADAVAKHKLDESLSRIPSAGMPLDPENPAAFLSPGPETLASWLQSLGELQRSITGSPEFFKQAARSVFNPGGLDGGIVLKPNTDLQQKSERETDWSVIASHIPYPESGISFRSDLIQMAADQRSTVFHDSTMLDQTKPANDIHSAVASPVFDESDNVVAIVYGFRSLHPTNHRSGIRPLEAQFVKVIADTVTSGIVRMNRETKATRSKVLLEHAFSPTVARELETNPDILKGRSQEVSVLFADLRGFSTISEQIGTQQTYELLTDVMDCFSQIIARHDGLIIDFYGDGVSAFWNAPLDQPNHASLACETALEIADAMPQLNSKWSQRIGIPLKVGVGVNSGLAEVGNSGSRTRLKYGPRGNTVNVASRLEAITKKVGVPVLISAHTARQLSKHGDQFYTRKICSTRLPGIQETTELFDLMTAKKAIGGIYGIGTDPMSHFKSYAVALASYENGNLEEAILRLSNLQLQCEGEPVSAFLLTEALRCKSLSLGEFMTESESGEVVAIINANAN